MEKDRKPSVTELMRPALREGYRAVQNVLKANEFKAEIKFKYSPSGNICRVEFNNLTAHIRFLAEMSVWNVCIYREKRRLDKNNRVLGFTTSDPASDMPHSNKAYISLS
jgi:hypothetical protein